MKTSTIDLLKGFAKDDVNPALLLTKKETYFTKVCVWFKAFAGVGLELPNNSDFHES